MVFDLVPLAKFWLLHSLNDSFISKHLRLIVVTTVSGRVSGQAVLQQAETSWLPRQPPSKISKEYNYGPKLLSPPSQDIIQDHRSL